MKHTLKLITLGIAALLLVSLFIAPAAAADNATINATNSSATNSTAYQPDEPAEPATPLFISTDEYAEQYDYWYSYYQSINQPNKEQIKTYLLDSTTNSETKFNNILSYIGRSQELLTFMDESKRTIDEYTGSITYNLGFFNGIANLFGGGVKDSDLPQNVAQGNAMYDVYKDNYNLFVDVMREIDGE